MEYNFNDKVVVVTGASSGIGAQIALDFARHGAKLALAGRNETNLQTTVAKCVEAGQSLENIYTFIGDLQEEEEINRLIEGTVDKFGSIHVLVNNAGSYDRGNIESSSVSGLDSMYNIHVRSVFLLTQRALPKLLETKGNIVNLSSVCGKRPLSHCLPYSVSKAALDHLTACVANDVAARGVRVNAVAPGVIETEIFHRTVSDRGGKESNEEYIARKGADHPMERIGNVEEVSRAVLFLASDAASFTTGVILPVDGGRINKV